MRQEDYKQFRGQFDKQVVEQAIERTRMSEKNKTIIMRYLVDGVRVRDLEEEYGVSKQSVHSKIRAGVERIVG